MNSLLLIFATVFFVPKALAIIQLFMFMFSSGVTAIYRSASSAPASLRVFRLDGDAFMVIRS